MGIQHILLKMGHPDGLKKRVAYLSVVQLPVHIDLTLCDVPSQIRDWMSDICWTHTNIFSHMITERHNYPTLIFTVTLYMCPIRASSTGLVT